MLHTIGNTAINPVETFYESVGILTPKEKGFTFQEIAQLHFHKQVESNEEVKANAALIVNAFNTTNESGMTPSQLLSELKRCQAELLTAVEFGYLQCEKGNNLQQALANASLL